MKKEKKKNKKKQKMSLSTTFTSSNLIHKYFDLKIYNECKQENARHGISINKMSREILYLIYSSKATKKASIVLYCIRPSNRKVPALAPFASNSRHHRRPSAI